MSNVFRCKKNEDEKHPTRYYSSKQEVSVAKAISGKRQPNSGATMFMPGDVVSNDNKWLFECKTCTKKQKSFSIKEDWFIKNKEESVLANKEYCSIVFNFGPDQPNYYIVDEQTFNLMKEALQIIEQNYKENS